MSELVLTLLRWGILIALWLLVLFVQSNPQYQNAVVLVLQVLILFLTSAGYYTTGKWWVEFRADK